MLLVSRQKVSKSYFWSKISLRFITIIFCKLIFVKDNIALIFNGLKTISLKIIQSAIFWQLQQTMKLCLKISQQSLILRRIQFPGKITMTITKQMFFLKLGKVIIFSTGLRYRNDKKNQWMFPYYSKIHANNT